jgi:hypothetical protein
MAGNRTYATGGVASVGNINIYDVNVDPNGTVQAPIGSLAIRRTAGSINFYQNVNGAAAAADAVWDLLPTAMSAPAEAAVAGVGALLTSRDVGGALNYSIAT